MFDDDAMFDVVVTMTGDEPTKVLAVCGGPVVVAAALRSLADQLDPPKPPKPVMR